MVLDGRHVLLRYRGQERRLQYQTRLVELDEDEKIYQSKDREGKVTEEYSTTGFKVKLKREYGDYLVLKYFPAALMVIVSFLCYLIKQKEMLARMGLLVTLDLIEVDIM